jgi:hypothetical protein
MRYFAVGALLLFAVASAPAFAAPDDLPAYPPVVPPLEVTPPPVADVPLAPVVDASPAPVVDAVPAPAARLAPAPAVAPPVACENCAPPRIYDSQEVIKRIREIDHSKVINTTEIVPIIRYAPEPPQPERRLVRVPSVTVVHFVTHQYKVIEGPVATYAEVPVVRRRAKDCSRTGSCRRVLRVGG